MAAEKQRALAQIGSMFAYLPDDADAAERLRPWLTTQLKQFLGALTYGNLEMPELMGVVAVLAPPFSRVVGRSSTAQQPFAKLRLVREEPDL
ncbi:hypothetical protein [Mycolicibacterium wolinskyi]|uniref:hypothetical protein n=1 Tax=Mycolicibacterium wolinskyi TaxID=59750 RepID=UPI003917680F